MDAPQIQYATTSDGVSIAFWTLGEGGTPLVMTSPRGYSHIALECGDRELSAWYEHLAQRRMIIRFDHRGWGLSERDLDDEAIAGAFGGLDIAAVVGRLGLQRLDLLAYALSSVNATHFAAERPDLVERLVLVSPGHGPDFARRPQISAVWALAKDDWRLFTETWAHMFMGWSQGELARRNAALLRQCTTQDYMVRSYDALHASDLAPHLARIQAATLVLSDAQGRLGSNETARLVAAGVRDARLARYETGPGGFYRNEQARAVIEQFLAEGEQAQPPAELPQGMTAILFADIADSTALTERLGDAAFREKARELDEALRRAITSNGGTAIDGKLLGDGVLATFGAAREAIACAAAIHAIAGPRAMGQGPSPDQALSLHVGIHAGDVIRERAPDGRDNVYGGAVNIAARVASEAAAGETLVSATVRDLARTSAGVSFEDRGERELKGVGEPVRVFAVRSDG